MGRWASVTAPQGGQDGYVMARPLWKRMGKVVYFQFPKYIYAREKGFDSLHIFCMYLRPELPF